MLFFSVRKKRFVKCKLKSILNNLNINMKDERGIKYNIYW